MREIYSAVAEHQRHERWQFRDQIAVLHSWSERFILSFKLELEEHVISIEPLRRNRLGHFRPGHNGLGLKGEIALNALHLSSRSLWQTLGTLLHELLHAWQAAHGTPSANNYHNDELRAKAADLGLLINARGVTRYAEGNTPFACLLKQHGIDVPDRRLNVLPLRLPGHSKMKKFSCGCTNVRCAVPHFYAQCLRCGQVFRSSEQGGSREQHSV